jgi:hypothetical protein
MLEYTQAGDGARLMMLVRYAPIRLRTGIEGRDLLGRSHGRGQTARLGGYQHEERLETNFFLGSSKLRHR